MSPAPPPNPRVSVGHPSMERTAAIYNIEYNNNISYKQSTFIMEGVNSRVFILLLLKLKRHKLYSINIKKMIATRQNNLHDEKMR